MFNTDVYDVRVAFLNKLNRSKFVGENIGSRTIEVVNAGFVADKDTIFGTLNEEWWARELEWYMKMSLNVNDIRGEIPDGWKRVSGVSGEVNSNYGWCVFHKNNHSQIDQVILELRKRPDSRRAVCIYTRPEMWHEYNENGKDDFMCTNVVQYLIRDGLIHSVVQMRSNDVVWGYKNDIQWQRYVLRYVHKNLLIRYPDLKLGNVYWSVGSLHLYERHWWLADAWGWFGEAMSRDEYNKRVTCEGGTPL